MPVDCVKPLRGGCKRKSRTQCTDTQHSASVTKPCAAPTVDLRCKRCKRGYRRLLHTLRIVGAMTNAAKFSQWIPRRGEASGEFRDFSFKSPQTCVRPPHARREHTPDLTFSTTLHVEASVALICGCNGGKTLFPNIFLPVLHSYS